MLGLTFAAQVNNSTVTAAFAATLLLQGLAALLILAALWLAWLDVRARRAAAGNGPAPGTRAPRPAEPAGRRVLRIGFGLLWIFDGVLQAQPGMPAGLPTMVIEPSAASSPHWVQQLVTWAGTTWSYIPCRPRPPRCGSSWASGSGCW